MPTPSKPASSQRATNAARSGKGRPTGTRIETRSGVMGGAVMRADMLHPDAYDGQSGNRDEWRWVTWRATVTVYGVSPAGGRTGKARGAPDSGNASRCPAHPG